MKGAIPTFGKPDPNVQYENRPSVYALLFDKDRKLAVIETSHGRFLPGGGVDPNETDKQALFRELKEEMGWRLLDMEFFADANQYGRSVFYKKYFLRQGRFYRAQALPDGAPTEKDHTLLWLPLERAVAELKEEYQRFIVGKLIGD
jgi:8-oxo-dGTP diphosphatase